MGDLSIKHGFPHPRHPTAQVPVNFQQTASSLLRTGTSPHREQTVMGLEGQGLCTWRNLSRPHSPLLYPERDSLGRGGQKLRDKRSCSSSLKKKIGSISKTSISRSYKRCLPIVSGLSRSPKMEGYFHCSLKPPPPISTQEGGSWLGGRTVVGDVQESPSSFWRFPSVCLFVYRIGIDPRDLIKATKLSPALDF